jgi:hypothetical protein
MADPKPVTSIRLPPALHTTINVYLRQREALPTVEPWTFTDFVVCACRELLRKKAWRRGKAQVIHQAVETPEEEMIEASMLDFAIIGLGTGDGI